MYFLLQKDKKHREKRRTISASDAADLLIADEAERDEGSYNEVGSEVRNGGSPTPQSLPNANKVCSILIRLWCLAFSLCIWLIGSSTSFRHAAFIIVYLHEGNSVLYVLYPSWVCWLHRICISLIMNTHILHYLQKKKFYYDKYCLYTDLCMKLVLPVLTNVGYVGVQTIMIFQCIIHL